MRKAQITRVTNETRIELDLTVDGSGKYDIQCPCGFLTHMLELFTRHGRFDLRIKCEGDSHVDYHHITEDIGISLGRAFSDALGDFGGINRYGSIILPMDEALVMAAIDICGRAYLGYEANIPSPKTGDFDTELVQEFFLGFTRSLGASLHIRQIAGSNSHHIIEAMFKGFGRALAEASAINSALGGEIPSTKGLL